jgi:hypothetical protein
MADNTTSTPSRTGGFIWEMLRKRKVREIDALQRDMVKGRFERREFAGDPNQAEYVRIPLKHRNRG